MRFLNTGIGFLLLCLLALAAILLIPPKLAAQDGTFQLISTPARILATTPPAFPGISPPEGTTTFADPARVTEATGAAFPALRGDKPPNADAEHGTANYQLVERQHARSGNGHERPGWES